MTPEAEEGARRLGLCATCRHHRVVTTLRGSRFHLCELSRAHTAYPRYPRLPVVRCAGHTPSGERPTC